ncbi:MAG: hypothetical protein QG656_1525 [Candidatus Hydrogenedentes bacterium]|nr:hypothetical protein [Candidatus Hydrogenedentota bacterium]
MKRFLNRHAQTVAVVALFAVFPLLMGQDSCYSMSGGLDWNLNPVLLPGQTGDGGEGEGEGETDRWTGTWTSGGYEFKSDQAETENFMTSARKEGTLVISKKDDGYLVKSKGAESGLTMKESGDTLVFTYAGDDAEKGYVKRSITLHNMGGGAITMLDGAGGFDSDALADLDWTWGDCLYMYKKAPDAVISKWTGVFPVFRTTVDLGEGANEQKVQSGAEYITIVPLGNDKYYIQDLGDNYDIDVEQVENHLEGYETWTNDDDTLTEAFYRLHKTETGVFVTRSAAVWDSGARAKLLHATYEVMAPLTAD